MEKSVSSDFNDSGTVLDRPIKDYVTEKPEPSTPEDSSTRSDDKKRGSDQCNGKSESDGKVCFQSFQCTS